MTVSPFRKSSKPVLIVEARFYEPFADSLVEAAIEVLQAEKVPYERFAVPGVFELPAAISMAAETGNYGGFIALGCVIRGETTHYDYVCEQSARALMDLSVHAHLAIGFGIITAENAKQAEVRADKNGKNMGGKAAKAALRMMEAQAKFLG
ncbi:MAG: 6,7-dimethyl-8-ribityllumazine synthase [Rickettsiales bacterium]|jgi:6,7-dimethyl-8-ribityllumazine synthase|nr:6,7-dimethyl-8-ribityllumazine synthase [Rickettsiales bacterium]